MTEDLGDKTGLRPPGCVHVGTRIDEHLYYMFVARACGDVNRQNSIENRIDRLAVHKGIFDQAFSKDLQYMFSHE
jgi:hypothetical protein